MQRLKRKLKKLKKTERLQVCFGSKKLFNAQHNLAENGYQTRQEWVVDWSKKRQVFMCGKISAWWWNYDESFLVIPIKKKECYACSNLNY
ncbi:MAG: hypothetical protein QNJ68_00200 [Microcoleaceae cyanobacterium MO_207.B10]|nr:hypothetical protein [Microcoleaceae cyanobacterium MO_207.B10]